MSGAKPCVNMVSTSSTTTWVTFVVETLFSILDLLKQNEASVGDYDRGSYSVNYMRASFGMSRLDL